MGWGRAVPAGLCRQERPLQPLPACLTLQRPQHCRPCPAGEASEAWGERRSPGLAGAWPGREVAWRAQKPGHCVQSWTPQPGLQGDGVPCSGLDSRDPRHARGVMTQPCVWPACAPHQVGDVDSEAPSSAPTPSPDFLPVKWVGAAALHMPLRSSFYPPRGLSAHLQGAPG